MKWKYSFVLWLWCLNTLAQNDTANVLTFRQYQALILQYNPIIKQANGLNELAKADLMIAKGSFDPKFESSFDTKYLDKKNYFNFWDNVVKVPLSFAGIDLKAGFERNVGQVLGSDIRTPIDGISYFGLNIPLGQKMLIDERRTTLQNAQLLQKMADNERVKFTNKYLYSAAKEYWNWYFAHQNLTLLNDFYKLANQRYDLVKKRVLQGDLAAIDTADAQVTLFDRQIMLQQAQTDVENARLLLSNYLWKDDVTPLEITPTTLPQLIGGVIFDKNKINNLLETAQQLHPDIQKLNFKTQQLKIDTRLSKEMLKPRFDIGISSLNYMHRYLTGMSQGSIAFADNFKLNVDFTIPLFFRKERGKYQSLKIKQWQNELELLQTRREIKSEIDIAYNELRNLEIQIKQQQIAIDYQQQVLNIEEKRFQTGETQLFIVNQRESKLIELQQKLALLKTKYEKAKVTLLFSAGQWE